MHKLQIASITIAPCKQSVASRPSDGGAVRELNKCDTSGSFTDTSRLFAPSEAAANSPRQQQEQAGSVSIARATRY